jgi:EpsI family protein
MPPLEQMNQQIEDWQMVSQSHPDKETQDLLRADDALTRIFRSGNESLSLFVAYFRTQRAGVVPHSPRVCLPGAGWKSESLTYEKIPVPNRAEPIEVNRYVVSRGKNKSIVYYWYQSPNHVVADEFAAKVYLVLDSIRYQRSDTAIIRVIIPVDSRGEKHADQVAVEFIKKAYKPVTGYLPS